MATLTEIAAALGVSEATVSNALSGKGRMKRETRDRIIREVEKTDYRAHHSPKYSINNVIVISELCDGAYVQSIVDGVAEAVVMKGLVWPVYYLNLFQRGYARNADTALIRPMVLSLISRLPYQPSGLIYISQYPRKMPGFFDGLNIPVVAVQLLDSGANAYVNSDNQQAAYEVVRHMYALGKRRIAIISGEIDSYSSSERMIGYQRALIDCSLPYHPKRIWVGDWSKESGYQLTQKLMDASDPPDAIFAQNDAMARGGMELLLEKGIRIPDDVSLIGFDDDESNWLLKPALSSVKPPWNEMGREAFEKICALIRKERAESAMLPCRLVLRDSG